MPARAAPSNASPSPGPPHPPLSKRDKRRNNISEKLTDMINSFTTDHQQHYRAQLHAIQVDMTLVLRADPYANVPLEDGADDIAREIESITNGQFPSLDAGRDGYEAMAGRRYHDYTLAINAALEQRDADLTALKDRYDESLAELERGVSYRIDMAQREHHELISTIRSRLTNTLTKKRDRLLKDRDHADIGDNSALFLNPSQFAFNFPASPALSNFGPGSRKTRGTRNRLGEGEEPTPLIELSRKRKAPADDDLGGDTPLFPSQPLDSLQEAKAKTLQVQYEAPAYSIERLFTEKELAHASCIAQAATHQLFHARQRGAEMAARATEAVQSNGDGAADESPTKPASPPPAAAGMERTVSHHATRNATRSNPLAALSEAAAMTSGNPSFVPALIPITKTDKGAPTPPGLNGTELESDLAVVLGLKKDESGGSDARRLLEMACAPAASITSAPFRLPITDMGPAAINGGVNRIPAYGFADPASLRYARSNGAAASAVLATATSAATNGLQNLPVEATSMSRTSSVGGTNPTANDAGTSTTNGTVPGLRRVRSRLV